MRKAGAVFSTLRHRGFRWLWVGQTVSAIGDQLYTVAIAAELVDSGRGAGDLGLVLGALALGLVLFSPVAGVVADRVPRRTVMAGADILRFACVLAIALTPGAPTVVIAVLAFAVGAGEAFFNPAYQGLLPRVIDAERLQHANAVTSLSRQTAMLLGPGAAGLLLVISGPSLALFVDASTFLVALFTLLAVNERVPELDDEQERMPMLAEVAEGFQAIRDRPWIGAVVLMAMVHLLFAFGPWEVLMPIVAKEELGGVQVYGFLLATLGVGAIIGALIGGRIRPRQPGVVGLLGLIPFGFVMFALAGPAPVWLIAVLLVAMGIGEQIFDVLWVTALQREVPDRLLSRVFSLDYLGSLALLPVGLALAGPAADLFGRTEFLIFGGFVAIVTIAPLLLMPTTRAFSGGPGERGAVSSPAAPGS